MNIKNRLLRAESDYRGLEVTNPLLSPIESLVLDLALAASVQVDFENAPPDTPFYIELDNDFVGTGADPEEAITEARETLIAWELRERRERQLEINPPAYVIPGVR